MSDKTDDQIAKEKAAVEAMRNARSNMAAVLDRVSTLEKALRDAAGQLDEAAKQMPNAYAYESRHTLKEYYAKQAENARRVLL